MGGGGLTCTLLAGLADISRCIGYSIVAVHCACLFALVLVLPLANSNNIHVANVFSMYGQN